MPELPEVETMRRGMAPLVGATIVQIAPAECKKRPLSVRPGWKEIQAKVRGKSIRAVERHGKRIVFRIDTLALVFEPRMTGLLLLDDPPTTEHLRVRIDLEKCAHEQAWFWDQRGLGTVRLFEADDFQSEVVAKLGEDALTISVDRLRDVFRESARPIKVALLDQTKLAGVGNLYASECLCRAGVDPRTRCDALTKGQWERIHGQIVAVLEEAIQHNGSSLGDGTYRSVLDGESSYQNLHLVYDRANEPCMTCGEPIKRIVQAQRSTFFCPRCQTKSGRGTVKR